MSHVDHFIVLPAPRPRSLPGHPCSSFVPGGLQEFDVDDCSLTGTIPTGFYTCFPDLIEIDLSYNKLTGKSIAGSTAALRLARSL